MSKYRAVRHNGFASKREANRASELELMAKCGAIIDLQYQPQFELVPKLEGQRAVHYIGDFSYRDKDGRLHIEDAKGFKTEVYRLKKKLLKWRHGISIEEV